MFSERRRRGQTPGCASLSLPGRRRVPARSPGLRRQEGKFDEAVGEERDTLLGDAGNLQPVLQDVEFHRPPALRGGSSAGGEPRPPPPARPAGSERRGQPAREPGAGRRAGRGGQRGGPPSREGPRAAGEGGSSGGAAAHGARRGEQLVFAVTNNLPLKHRPAGHARPWRGVPGLVVALRLALPAAYIRGGRPREWSAWCTRKA